MADTNMTSLIVINYEGEKPTVSGRDVHDALDIETPYHKWFPRMCEYGFTEGEDFNTDKKVRVQIEGDREVSREVTDHQITIPMAKEICMLQRNDKGKMFRQYFIKIEELWNSPDMVMKRALVIADNRVKELTMQIEKDRPKVLFANAVETSQTSILIGDMAKLLKQNGMEIGQNRLFEKLREENYLIKSGSSKNMPTQRAMEMGLFEVKERTIDNPDGSIRITKTTKVTGKGQIYFINKFIGKFDNVMLEYNGDNKITNGS